MLWPAGGHKFSMLSWADIFWKSTWILILIGFKFLSVSTHGGTSWPDPVPNKTPSVKGCQHSMHQGAYLINIFVLHVSHPRSYVFCCRKHPNHKQNLQIVLIVILKDFFFDMMRNIYTDIALIQWGSPQVLPNIDTAQIHVAEFEPNSTKIPTHKLGWSNQYACVNFSRFQV